MMKVCTSVLLPDLSRVETQRRSGEKILHFLGFSLIPLDCSSALDALMDDGHVYTTLDDSHFQIST
jgi:hypothetical protein